MSWNNCLPYWFYELEYEHWLAMSSCCTWQEWYSGTSKVLPKHLQDRNYLEKFKKDTLSKNFDSLVYPDPSSML